MEVVKLLVKAGADIHAREALIWACRKGRLEVVKYLVEQGANIHTQDSFGLATAVYNEQVAVVRYLVERRININKIQVDSITPLTRYKEILTALWSRLPKEELFPFLVSDNEKAREVAKEMLKEESYGIWRD